MKKLLSILILFFFVVSFVHAANVVPNVPYKLYDHPDGVLTSMTVSYGLRLDSLGGSAEERTFSTQSDFGSYLYWNESDPAGAIIFGGLTRNSDSTQWGVVYIMDATASATGYTSTQGIGLLFGAGGLYGFTGKQGMSGEADGLSFLAQGDGHRLPDSTSEVGRGWLNVYDLGQFLQQDMAEEEMGMTTTQMLSLISSEDNWESRDRRYYWKEKLKYLVGICHEYEEECDITDGYNDWLVTMKPVPVPAALPLLGSALLGFSVFARRKKQEIQA